MKSIREKERAGRGRGRWARGRSGGIHARDPAVAVSDAAEKPT